MQADRVRALTKDIKVFAGILSRKDRPKKKNSDEYSSPEIYIYSDAVASVVSQKNNGEKGLALFYWIPAANNPRWQYFVVSDSHMVGLMQMANGPL